MLKKTRTPFILSALIVLFSCSDHDDTDSLRKQQILKDWNAVDFTVVKELPDGAKAAHVAPGGLIVDTQEVPVIASGGAGGTLEVYQTVPPGYVVTGLGALIASSTNNYTKLVIEYRYLNANGTLGPRFRVWQGGEIPVASLEAWTYCPDNTVAWKIGVGGKYDVYNMDLYYRTIALSGTTVKLTGTPSYMRSGLRQDGINQVIYTPENPNYGLDLDKTVIQGVGLMANNSGTSLMQIDAGKLQ